MRPPVTRDGALLIKAATFLTGSTLFLDKESSGFNIQRREEKTDEVNKAYLGA
uniref:AlNc14C73G4995 protein n=1 Tax=Albugo laibachii Nc14 TaxID=890382 RepID=F0WED8_9STRA|nr:AlNc14C73G4995 [Albugo laibachii Nc14]|eukprot:CCA19570.1 AlNc14C73G4995 [Albugo laibachii Nc14]